MIAGTAKGMWRESWREMWYGCQDRRGTTAERWGQTEMRIRDLTPADRAAVEQVAAMLVAASPITGPTHGLC